MSGTCADVRRGGDKARTAQSIVAGLGRFFASYRFPLLALSLLAALMLWLSLMLLLPPAETGPGALAREFRVWCFGYDHATGQLEWSYVVMLLLDPLVLALLIAALWRQPLRREWRKVKRLGPPALLGALGLVALTSAAVAGPAGADAGELPFPAAELRTRFTPPELDLINQAGERIALGDLRGQVVLVTGVYATCTHTCPVLMAQAKRALSALSPGERANVRVLAVTLDPEHDTPAVLRATETRYAVGLPEFNFLTGEPARVERVLDELQIARRRAAHSATIDHANLFLLVDKRGFIAYRLTIGERQERWLVSALRLLTREPAPEGA